MAFISSKARCGGPVSYKILPIPTISFHSILPIISPRHLIALCLKLIVNLGTFPYYRVYHFNTLQPIRLIAFYSSQPEQYNKLLYHLVRWRTRKLAELQFVSIACAILAAAVIGSFSWNAVLDAYWLTPAFWYSSLVLSILGVLQSAQQIAVLQLLGPLPTRGHDGFKDGAKVRRYLPLMMSEVSKRNVNAQRAVDRDRVGEWKPRYKMIFTWQCSTMLLAYSILFFLAGLTILVCTPLIRGNRWNSAYNEVAIVYLATSAVAGAVFMFCSFWIYHYVDLEHGSGDLTELEIEALD